MANNDLSNSENILVKVDQNNLIYIDPNSIVDNDGKVQPRNFKQENLVMYVNLEADLVPRSILVSKDQGSTLTNIAKGNLNFLKSQTGDGDFDTSYTDSFVGIPQLNNSTTETDDYFLSDKSGQNFGIDSISINIKGANFIPQVTINFVDVRGKVLFESDSNSPYKAFFHLPWPIFYLTVKGFYGKAIRYRLHMIKFSTRFNDSNGNFEVTTVFVGSTYAFLSDITLSQLVNSPYMFLNEKVENKKFNESTGRYEKYVSKGSKGYSILTSIFNEYKQKNLVPKDMPVKTLKELGYIAESLDKILEKEIFNKVVDMKVLSGVKDLEKEIENFENVIKAWANKNLTKDFTVKTKVLQNNNTTSENWYYIVGSDKTKLDTIIDKDKNGSLEKLIFNGTEQITKLLETVNSFSNKTNSDFKKVTLKSVKLIKDYFEKDSTNKVIVGIDNLINDIYKVRQSFDEQKNKLQNEVESKMNEIIKDPSKGFGFEPTIRNILAVILANADVYIRLMKDVHNRSFDNGNVRSDLLFGFTNEQSKNTTPIYPWPEVKKPNIGCKQNVIVYPGEADLITKLKSNDKNIWPEVDFVEEFIKIVTNRIDTNVKNEPTTNDINYIFQSDFDENKIDDISGIDVINTNLPYVDKTFASFIYEIYERAKYFTLFDSFSNSFLRYLVDEEYENIIESIDGNIDLIQLMKRLTTIESLISISTDNKILNGLIVESSPNDRFLYFRDNLPTIPYLKDIIEYPFYLEKYSNDSKSSSSFKKDELNSELLRYVPEPYRKNIYPFNSDLYLDYLDVSSFTDDNFIFNGILTVNPNQGFICSPINSESWVKTPYVKNMFLHNIKVDNNYVNILNTPYFHKQLFSDFINKKENGKYSGSAYLLLNSLPFLDLEDNITFNGRSILMSSLFREISSTHFIPYHLMLKWGSIYHRYKNEINNNVDILSGFLNSNNITQPITGTTFFDGGYTGTTYTAFTINSTTITHNTNIGINPFYQAVFHQVVNGYAHYNVSSGNTSYSAQTISNKIVHKKEVKNNNYWTVYVDNSEYNPSQNYYTLLPSNGFNNNDLKNKNNELFPFAQQYNNRIFWNDEFITSEFSGKTFALHSEYPRNYIPNSTIDNVFSIDSNYRKVIDLIGTFSPKILESFEEMFLDFASEDGNFEIPYQKFLNVNYPKFQDLLKDICTIEKDTNSTITGDPLLNLLKQKQVTKSEYITSNILNNKNLIKFTVANPKEIDPYTFYGIAQPEVFNYKKTLSLFNETTYSASDNTITNQNFIKLYIGEDIDNHYNNFFVVNNIKLSEENIIIYRPMVQIYAGYVKSGGVNTNVAFKQYLQTSIFSGNGNGIHATGSERRLQYFLNLLLKKLSSYKNESLKTKDSYINLYRGYNTDQTKLELYNTFKSFNDKWTSGNSIGQRLLLEEFLILDKSNRDIGDKFYLNIDKIIHLLDPKNVKINLYSAISILIQGTGLDMRALPSYVNFYGTNLKNKSKIVPSNTVANNLFGTFLEVDYQESSPKIIIQLVGDTSKRLDLSSISKEYKFSDDSFYIGSVNNNPLITTCLKSFSTNDLSKSNKVVAFEVSFGDQNQGIFKGVTLDQTSLKNTSESYVVLENLARSESGAGAYNVDVGLFDYYKQASYKCDVSCMGNVMIQPTMYFYLKNVPLFKGSYYITEVNHSIKSNVISTNFVGTRIPYTSLPDPKDSFIASYRVLFDKISNRAKSILKQQTETNSKTTSVEYEGYVYSTNMGDVKIPGENITKTTPKVGITEFGVPFNGYDNELSVQKVDNDGTWLRTTVVKMGGTNYPLEENTLMNIANGVLWSDVNNSDMRFYNLKFQLNVANSENIRTVTTEFKNPLNNKTLILKPDYQLDRSIGDIKVQGPISVGPRLDSYGMGMSPKLMSDLKINDGEVIYFRMS